MKTPRIFFLLLLLLTLLRLWFCSHFEVQPREAYWYLCGIHPDWAYFDAPGGVPLLAWVSTSIFGSSALGIRFFMPLFAFATSLLLYSLSRKYVKGWMAIFPVAVMNALPIFNEAAIELGGAMPSLMFSMLAACSAWKALKKEHRNAGWWTIAGLSVALGEFMHLAAAIVLISILCAAASTRKFRHEVIRPAFLCFLIPSILMATLFIVWNRHHDNIWLVTGTLSTALHFSVTDFLIAFKTALLGLNPLIAILAIYALVLLIRNIRLHVRPRMILAFCTPPIFLWFYLGLLGFAYSWLLVFPLGVLYIALAEYLENNKPGILLLAKVALLVAAIASASSIVRSQLAAPQWSVIAEKMLEVRQAQNNGDQVFLIGNDADTAAILSYHVRRLKQAPKDFPPVFVKESPGYDSQFSLWPRYEQFVETEHAPDEYFTQVKAANPHIGQSALFITDENITDENPLPQTIQGAFTEVGLLETITFPNSRGQFRIYHCMDYHTMPL